MTNFTKRPAPLAGDLVAASEVGQRVRVVAHGGRFTLDDIGRIGTVVRFTRQGNPVVAIQGREVSDTANVAAVIDADGKYVRPETQTMTETHRFDTIGELQRDGVVHAYGDLLCDAVVADLVADTTEIPLGVSGLACPECGSTVVAQHDEEGVRVRTV